MAIHQTVTFNCSPAKIYKTLITSADFGKATGAPADITAKEGGTFSGFDGQVSGRMIELKKDKMIVQAWRILAWPDGVYSIVRFTFAKSGDKTKVTLDHVGYPEVAGEHLEGGWHKMYWDPLKAFCK